MKIKQACRLQTPYQQQNNSVYLQIQLMAILSVIPV